MDSRRLTPPPTVDALLHPYLRATHTTCAERHLKQLLERHAQPVIDRVIWRKCGISPRAIAKQRRASSDTGDAYAVYHEALAHVTARLHSSRNCPRETTSIQDFHAYTFVIAHWVWYQMLQQRNPEREAMRCRLRYLLTYTPGLALWEDTDRVEGGLLCGLADWQAEERAQDPSRWRALPKMLASGDAPDDLRPLLFCLFRSAQAPVELNHLVSTLNRGTVTSQTTKT